MNICGTGIAKSALFTGLIACLASTATQAYENEPGIVIRDKGSLTIKNPASLGTAQPGALNMNCYSIFVEGGGTLTLDRGIINDVEKIALLDVSAIYSNTNNSSINDCSMFFVVPTSGGDKAIFDL